MNDEAEWGPYGTQWTPSKLGPIKPKPGTDYIMRNGRWHEFGESGRTKCGNEEIVPHSSATPAWRSNEPTKLFGGSIWLCSDCADA